MTHGTSCIENARVAQGDEFALKSAAYPGIAAVCGSRKAPEHRGILTRLEQNPFIMSHVHNLFCVKSSGAFRDAAPMAMHRCNSATI